MAQKGELPRIAFIWPTADEPRTVKVTPTNEKATIYRNIGIDGVTTSTISQIPKSRVAITPCGDESGAEKNGL